MAPKKATKVIGLRVAPELADAWGKLSAEDKRMLQDRLFDGIDRGDSATPTEVPAPDPVDPQTGGGLLDAPPQGARVNWARLGIEDEAEEVVDEAEDYGPSLLDGVGGANAEVPQAETRAKRRRGKWADGWETFPPILMKLPQTRYTPFREWVLGILSNSTPPRRGRIPVSQMVVIEDAVRKGGLADFERELLLGMNPTLALSFYSDLVLGSDGIKLYPPE